METKTLLQIPTKDASLRKDGVILHPLLLLNMSDHLTRVNYTQQHAYYNINNNEVGKMPIIGVLLGTRGEVQENKDKKEEGKPEHNKMSANNNNNNVQVEIVTSFEMAFDPMFYENKNENNNNNNPLLWDTKELLQHFVTDLSNPNENKIDVEAYRMFLQNEFTHEQLLWRYLLLNNNKNTGNSFLLEKEMMEKVETLKITFPECEVVGFYFVSTSNRVRDIAAFAVDFIQEKFLKLFYPSVLTNPNNNTLFYMLIGNEHPSRGNFTNVFEFQYNSNQNNNGNDQKLEIALHTCEETLCLTGSVDMPLTSLYHPQKQPSVHFLHINFKLDSDEIEFIGIDAVSYISLQKLNSNPKSNVTKNKTAQQLNSVNYLRQHIKIVLQYLELLRQKSPAEVSFQEYDVLRTLQTMVAQLPVESPGYTFHESTFNASINNNKNENHNHNHKHYPNAVQDEINNARSVALLSQLTHLTEEVERLGQQQRGVISQWHGRMEEGNDTKRRKHF